MNDDVQRRNKLDLAWTIVSIIIFLIFTPICIINTILIGKAALNDEVLPDVLGLSPLLVKGTLAPEFEDQAFIVTKKIDGSEANVGEIVCIKTNTGMSTQRIQGVTEDGKYVIQYPDLDRAVTISPDNILAKYLIGSEGLGKFILFTATPLGATTMTGLPTVAYIAYQFIIAFIERRKIKRHQVEAEQTRRRNYTPFDTDSSVSVMSIFGYAELTPNVYSEHAPPYRRAFVYRLARESPRLQANYDAVDIALLSRGAVRAQTAWHEDRYYVGKTLVAKILLKGSSLIMQANLTKTQARTLKVRHSKSKIRAETPATIKLNSRKGVSTAIKAIELLATINSQTPMLVDGNGYSIQSGAREPPGSDDG